MKTWLASTGVGAALSGLVAYCAVQSKSFITPNLVEGILIVAVFLFLGLVLSYGVSWTWTQVYKRIFVPDLTKVTPREVRMWNSSIIIHAMTTAYIVELAVGSGFLLFNFPPKILIVIATFWVLYGALLAGSSPFVWKYLFEDLLPRLKRNKNERF